MSKGNLKSEVINDLGDQIQRSYTSFKNQLDFNILSVLEEGGKVPDNHVKDLQETALFLSRQLDAILFETGYEE